MNNSTNLGWTLAHMYNFHSCETADNKAVSAPLVLLSDSACFNAGYEIMWCVTQARIQERLQFSSLFFSTGA